MRSAWQLPGYRVEELLGVGAFGEVWRATARATGAPVALKRIAMTEPTRRDSAVAEAAVLGALEHPGLVRLLALERTADAIVLVLELAAGGSLRDLLAARGRLVAGEVIAALAPIGAALAHAHAARVVHGDVTPANILFGDAGSSLLADLGVARLAGDTKPVHTTLPYADPCVVVGYLPDPASDVYMLGAVALHAITGHPPPAAAGQQDASVWSARLGALLARADVPGPVSAVITHAMALDPAARGAAADFALELRRAGTPVPVELFAGRSRSAPALARLAAIAAGRGTTGGSRTTTGGSRTTTGGSRTTADGSGARAHAGPAGAGGGHRVEASRHSASEPDRRPARHRGVGARRPRLALPVSILTGAAAALAAALVWQPWAGAASAPPAAERTAPATARSAAPDTAHRTAYTGRPTAPRAKPTTAPRPLPTGPPGATPTGPSGVDSTGPVTGPPDLATALRLLSGLDAVRARAFADRNPAVLRQVYTSPVLLARDQAALSTDVPPGCGLHGIRTAFGRPRLVRAELGRVELVVTARVGGSTLRCAGAAAGRALPAAASRLAITLVRAGPGWRIADQRPAGT